VRIGKLLARGRIEQLGAIAAETSAAAEKMKRRSDR
jgi:hypothetical protein